MIKKKTGLQITWPLSTQKLGTGCPAHENCRGDLWRYFFEAFISWKRTPKEPVLICKFANFAFRGLMPPVFTPFNADFSLNLSVIPKYVDFLYKQGIKGILVNGTSGEGMSMSVIERKQVTEAWIKEAHTLGIHVMVQVGGAPMADVKDLAKHAEAFGADSILVLPELFFKPANVADLVFYLEIIGKKAPNTPLLYYHNPGFSNVNINMPALVTEASKKITTFRGLKYTSCDLKEADQVLKACGENNTVFLGADQLLVAAGAQGFDSSIGTTFNMLPSIADDILLNIHRDNNMKRANVLQAELNEIIDVITKNGHWVSTMKVAMELITGIAVGPPRPPLRPLTEDQKKEMAVEFNSKKMFKHFQKTIP